MTVETDFDGRSDGGLCPAEVEALLFSAAMGFDTQDERERFLGFACRGKPDLLARIRLLSCVQPAADRFFEFESQVESLESAAASAAEADGLGVVMGRYRLIERIGSGGCGVVYLAEQQKPVRRKVALKMIRMGLENPEAIARFEMERQALASMNHPHIARVLDAGTNAGGRPYFVMELIDGEPITGYCDSRNLGIRDRLGLFVLVCQAIQHAHQKGVTHRDIKPTNVLVETHESTAVPKVIDFGLAQELSPSCRVDAGDKAADFLGTPTYMSPEQVAGNGEVDTRSDIFSLGMLLGELLAGPPLHLPSDLMERNPDDVRRIMLASRPLLPSALLEKRGPEGRKEIVGNRRIRTKSLSALCSRELDWVVGKAVHQDPSRRYETANSLAADVLRWLHGEEVSARPQSRSYRLAKLVRRNRLLCGAGALAFLGLLAGFSVATVLFLREKEARGAESRLRTQAEAAHHAEILARKSWEYRSRVADSAVRLRYGDLAGAEQLVEPIPMEETPPSLESISVYKQLADWHRAGGRIEEAEVRYLGMIHALAGIDRSHTDANSDMFLPAAALLARSSKPERYADLRRLALDLYADTRDRLVAERILKACLMKPLPMDELPQTAKLASVLEAVTNQQPEGRLYGWESLSVAMHYYRMADYDQAERWGMRSLDHSEFADRNLLTSLALVGLIWQKRGNEAKAMEFLSSVAADHRFQLNRAPDKFESENLWYDWCNLQTLMEEAGWKNGKFSRSQ